LNYARIWNRAMLSDLSDKCNSELQGRAFPQKASAHMAVFLAKLYCPPQELLCAGVAVRSTERSRVTPHFQAIPGAEATHRNARAKRGGKMG